MSSQPIADIGEMSSLSEQQKAFSASLYDDEEDIENLQVFDTEKARAAAATAKKSGADAPAGTQQAADAARAAEK